MSASEDRSEPPGGRPAQSPGSRPGDPKTVGLGGRADRPAGPRGGSFRRGAGLIIGRLQAHGRAHYEFRAEESLSYYVKLQTSRGERVLWGKDLERALTAGETQPKIGELVGARRVARKPVTIPSRDRDTGGGTERHGERHVHRTSWVLERVTFFAQRARLARQVRDEHADAREAVRAHPELRSTFISLRGAEDYAARRFGDPDERRRFLEGVRGAMGASIQKGEPLPSARLRDAPKRPESVSAPRPVGKRDREDPTR